jgi:lipopolysaccharide biosynthesis regulator YciM
MDWQVVAGCSVGALAAVALVSAGGRRRARRLDESLAYLRGMRFLLSDSPDAAIDQLTRAIALNPNSTRAAMETYFALGKLYRRKGDLERAIHLHQNILLRPGLPAEIKREAQFELAIDLHASGLLARSAEAFELVLKQEPAHAEALRFLREVHVQAKSLEAAAEVQVRAVKQGLGGEAVLAHLLAAAAREALPGRVEHALTLLDGAQKACPTSPDAALARAEALLAAGRRDEAASALMQLISQAPSLGLEVGPLLALALGADAPAAAALQPHEAGDPSVRVARARLLLRAGERAQATQALQAALQAAPGFAPARRDLGALLLDGPLDPVLMPAFGELLRAVALPELEQRCQACGHTQPEAAWQCPRCHAWDSLSLAPRTSSTPSPLKEISSPPIRERP